MRTLALALVLLTSTLQSAYGLLCNMAPAPGMLRSPLRRLPAPDATAFRRDGILARGAARLPRGGIFGSMLARVRAHTQNSPGCAKANAL